MFHPAKAAATRLFTSVASAGTRRRACSAVIGTFSVVHGELFAIVDAVHAARGAFYIIHGALTAVRGECFAVDGGFFAIRDAFFLPSPAL